MTTIVEDTKLDFSDVLLMPKRSTLGSRSEVELSRTFRFKHSSREYDGISILAANMDTTGTMEMARAFTPFNMGIALHKFYTPEQLIEYFKSPDMNPNTFYSMGITPTDFEKFQYVYKNVNPTGFLSNQDCMRPLKYVCIDVANGYSRKFVNFVETVREHYPDLVIMAGNVVTGDMVYDLIERGADIVKIGIGSGASCLTRKITGVGYPQLSACIETAEAAHGAGGHICSDGGIQVPGDIAKAYGAGADFVMIGGMFAGHRESGGEEIYSPNSYTKDSPKELIPNVYPMSKRFYGMSSHEAMDKHYGGKANYRASEGKVVEVPYRGSVSDTIEEMLGGLRSACTYTGSKRLKDLAKCATFIKVNRILNNSLSQYDV
jgi:GMP reductase